MAENGPQSGSGPVARVRTLATQMRDRCMRLDELSSGIQVRLNDESPEAVVELLAQREPLVVELARLGDEMAAILDDPQSARVLGESEHGRIRSCLQQLEQVMGRIRERDKQARATLQRRRDELAERLASMKTSSVALRAYAGGGRAVNPTMQDSRG